MKHKSQKTLTSLIEGTGEARKSSDEGAMCVVAREEIKSPRFTPYLMEEVLSQRNLNLAYKRVMKNKGAPGVDGVSVDELKSQIHDKFSEIKEALLRGDYRPSPVKRVEIPKPNGGIRQLGIPTVMDRLIQQAFAQVLQRGFDPTFSNSSFGFRPGRSAHQAIDQASKFQQEGNYVVVDIDLAKFFDEVNHDRLMSKLARSITDKRVLRVIRAFLRSGVLEGGLVTIRGKGTPQGGPLSPLLSNIVLDELDKELEARGHKFVRYADDCNIYVQSERAAKRVMDSVRRFIENKLKLRINEEKSKVSLACRSEFLGASFTPSFTGARSRVSRTSIKRFKDRIKQLTSGRKRVKFKKFIEDLRVYLNGWKGYFGKLDANRILFKNLDQWIRRRIRAFIWQQWRKVGTRYKKLKKFGINDDLALRTAASRKGSWRISNTPAICFAFPNSYFDRVGLPELFEG